MAEEGCSRCRIIRMVLLSLGLGGGAGFATLGYGGSSSLSMLATFFAALVPLLWHARHNRIRREGSQ